MYPKFKLVKIMDNLFSSSRAQISPKMSALQRGQIDKLTSMTYLMICKNVIHEGLSMSITPQSLAEPPFALLYLSYSQIHRLIAQNKK